jgi:prevent-host-death family protein
MVTHVVEFADAEADLARLIDLVGNGDEVVITRDGRPVARLVPVPADYEAVHEFTTSAENADFKGWLRDHRHGFYLNERSRGAMMLHRVGCHHIGSGEGFSTTSNAKAAADSREALLTWAAEKGLPVVDCSTCRPR